MDAPVKVLFKGQASVRDYLAEKSIEKGETFKIKYDGDVMTLSPEEVISKRISISKEEYTSKFGTPSKYRLWNYWWEPDQIEL
jgi:hypothetical protein